MSTETLPPSRILIVDDTSSNIAILGEALSADYEILIARNGAQALEIAQSANPPDLILLDIIMPGMDGYEVCRRLKIMKETRTIPVIFITAMATEEDETKGLQLGAVDYITKPFSLPIVKVRVKTHLQLKHQNDMLIKLSSCDGLTGVFNRRRFDELYSQEWHRALRGQQALGIIMVDIDFFKTYNDSYGHAQGDECLREVAKTLDVATRRPADKFARYGGEEFVALLPDTDIQGCLALGETMRKAVEQLGIPHAHSKAAQVITISVGVASLVPDQAAQPETLLKMADDMLYKAKKTGRNRVVAP